MPGATLMLRLAYLAGQFDAMAVLPILASNPRSCAEIYPGS